MINIFFLSVLLSPCCHALVFTFKPEDILHIVSSSCLIALPESVNDTNSLDALSTLSDVSYKAEPLVTVGRVKTSAFQWPNGKILEVDEQSRSRSGSNSLSTDFNNPPVFLIFKRVVKDRTCLLVPTNIILPEVVSYRLESKRDYNINYLVDFINHNCDTFRKQDGELSIQGLHRNYILQNVFSVAKPKMRNLDLSLSDETSIKNNYLTLNKDLSCENPNTIFTYANMKLKCDRNYNESFNIPFVKRKELLSARKCDRISLPSPQDFLHNYVFKSKPVIITGATQNWPAFKKWTNRYLRDLFGDKIVHVKMTPTGEYEGVEKVQLWENGKRIKIPKEVLSKLPYPDLVVVRPATTEIKFSKFLDLIESVAMKETTNVSAYLEYSSVKDYFSELLDDFEEMSFFKGFLNLKHINMWLSDGNTVGKLHFDPFDNFMCQISGEKEFILYDPHQNERLYEAHLQEAMLSYNQTTQQFFRKHLLDSTSMVMSPVDIENPDIQRFPKFSEAIPMSCEIKSGEVLYTPAFWWHEVRSSPNVTERRNLAVNFWYEPFLQKEFPCAECGLDVNPHYFHLL